MPRLGGSTGWRYVRPSTLLRVSLRPGMCEIDAQHPMQPTSLDPFRGGSGWMMSNSPNGEAKDQADSAQRDSSQHGSGRLAARCCWSRSLPPLIVAQLGVIWKRARRSPACRASPTKVLTPCLPTQPLLSSQSRGSLEYRRICCRMSVHHGRVRRRLTSGRPDLVWLEPRGEALPCRMAPASTAP